MNPNLVLRIALVTPAKKNEGDSHNFTLRAYFAPVVLFILARRGGSMPDWKEFRFKIEGKVNGVEMTPYTMPLARLVLYLTDLAQLLGHRECVHLISVEGGSTVPVIYVDPEEESRVVNRVKTAQRGMGPRDANRAYKKIDRKLREDNAVGSILDVAQKAEVIEFPGRRIDLPQTYGPIRERASVVGQLMRVGGLRPEMVPVHIQRSDEVIFYCDTSQYIARDLAPLLYRNIRVHGLATYSRGKEGFWTVDRFKIQAYDPEPLADDSFSMTMEKLRAIPGNEWAQMADPLEELYKLRHGEEEGK
jgi:hypothetical protein